MKKSVLRALCVAVGSLVITGAAWAHHGDADRYNDDATTVTGTVVQVQFVNPHAIIEFDVVEGGKTIRWQAELGAPQIMAQQWGWTTRTLKVGDKITVTGRRVKSGGPYMNLRERSSIVLTASGKDVYRSEGTAKYGLPPGKSASGLPPGV